MRPMYKAGAGAFLIAMGLLIRRNAELTRNFVQPEPLFEVSDVRQELSSQSHRAENLELKVEVLGDRLLLNVEELECRAGIAPGCEKPKPFFQLERRLKVVLCPNNSTRAFDTLIREGLEAHSKVDLLHSQRAEEADYILHIAKRGPELEKEGSTCPPPHPTKTIVLDEADDAVKLYVPDDWFSEAPPTTDRNPQTAPKFLAAFKRSFVLKDTSEFSRQGQMLGFTITRSALPSYFPIQYPIRDIFIPERYPPWRNRSLEVINVLRPENSVKETGRGGGRSKAQKWMLEFVETQKISSYHSGPASGGKRGKGDSVYLETLQDTKILVTCNPSFWEGDHRTGEGLVSGAMVMVDHMWSPCPYPLLDHWHVVYYDLTNRVEFLELLEYYHAHDEEARKIAARGAYHVQRYMGTVTTVDYILCTGEHLNGVKTDYVRTGPRVMKDFGNIYSAVSPHDLYPFTR